MCVRLTSDSAKALQTAGLPLTLIFRRSLKAEFLPSRSRSLVCSSVPPSVSDLKLPLLALPPQRLVLMSKTACITIQEPRKVVWNNWNANAPLHHELRNLCNIRSLPKFFAQK